MDYLFSSLCCLLSQSECLKLAAMTYQSWNTEYLLLILYASQVLAQNLDSHPSKY